MRNHFTGIIFWYHVSLCSIIAFNLGNYYTLSIYCQPGCQYYKLHFSQSIFLENFWCYKFWSDPKRTDRPLFFKVSWCHVGSWRHRYPMIHPLRMSIILHVRRQPYWNFHPENRESPSLIYFNFHWFYDPERKEKLLFIVCVLLAMSTMNPE